MSLTIKGFQRAVQNSNLVYRMLVDRNKIIKQINQVNTPVVIISGEVEKK